MRNLLNWQLLLQNLHIYQIGQIFTAVFQKQLVFCPLIFTDLIKGDEAHFRVNSSEPLTWSSAQWAAHTPCSHRGTKRNRFSNVTAYQNSWKGEKWGKFLWRRALKINPSLFPEYSKTHLRLNIGSGNFFELFCLLMKFRDNKEALETAKLRLWATKKAL